MVVIIEDINIIKDISGLSSIGSMKNRSYSERIGYMKSMNNIINIE